MARVVLERTSGAAVSERLASLPERKQKQAQKILVAQANKVLNEAKALVPTDMGELKESGRVVIDKRLGHLLITVMFGNSKVPYAIFVHEGTSAPRKAPPRARLVAWARRHFAVDQKEAEQIAYLIGRKIAREGTKAVKYLEIPFRRNIPKTTAMMRKAGV